MYRSVRVLLGLLLLAVLLGPAERTARADERVLLAIYYAWFDQDSFGPGLTSATPAVAYNSDDPAAIGRQLDQAGRAGLDGFIVSWLGPGNRTDRNLAQLLDQAAGRGFRIGVYVETQALGGPDQVAESLEYLLRTYGSHPAFLRKDGRPVLFFWRQQVFPPAAWPAIRDRVDPDRATLWIAEGDTAAYFATFDGLHLFSIAWAPDPARPLGTWAARTRAEQADGRPRLWIPTIMPGYDDLAVRGGFARDRQGGAYYLATMDAALATDPEWAVIITSWNEWPEGTQIEPGVGYGDLYLDLTAYFAARLKR